MEYKIDVLKVAQFPETPGSEIYWMSNFGDDKWETLAVYALLIRGGGHTILVNSGYLPLIIYAHKKLAAGPV